MTYLGERVKLLKELTEEICQQEIDPFKGRLLIPFL